VVNSLHILSHALRHRGKSFFYAAKVFHRDNSHYPGLFLFLWQRRQSHLPTRPDKVELNMNATLCYSLDDWAPMIVSRRIPRITDYDRNSCLGTHCKMAVEFNKHLLLSKVTSTAFSLCAALKCYKNCLLITCVTQNAGITIYGTAYVPNYIVNLAYCYSVMTGKEGRGMVRPGQMR